MAIEKMAIDSAIELSHDQTKFSFFYQITKYSHLIAICKTLS